jgi:hypothetical protein
MRTAAIAVLAICLSATSIGIAHAMGTVRVQQRDGAVKTYTNVRVRVQNREMFLTSSDGEGTIILSKAACTMVGALMQCLPYQAALDQDGRTVTIVLKSGTVWLNPSDTKQQLPLSSTQLPPRGVLLSVRTKADTYVSLVGTVDEVTK